jgi:hypothetical protein
MKTFLPKTRVDVKSDTIRDLNSAKKRRVLVLTNDLPVKKQRNG